MKFWPMLRRALLLTCPECGQQAIFRPWSYRMQPACSSCGLDFRREPGFYLGTIYINYGITSVVVLACYLIMAFVLGIDSATTLGVCLACAVLLPLALFRHARSLWLAMDRYIDRT